MEKKNKKNPKNKTERQNNITAKILRTRKAALASRLLLTKAVGMWRKSLRDRAFQRIFARAYIFVTSSNMEQVQGSNSNTDSTPTTPLNLLIKFLALFSPPRFLSPKPIDQRRSIGHLPPARLCVINQCLFVAHGLIVFGLHGVQLTLFLIQLLLCSIQFSLGFL